MDSTTIFLIIGVLVLAYISYMVLNPREGFWGRRGWGGWPRYNRYGHWRPIVKPVVPSNQPIIYDWTNADGEQFYRYN